MPDGRTTTRTDVSSSPPVKISASVDIGARVHVRTPASRLGGVARSRAHQGGGLVGVGDAARHRRDVVHAVAAGQLVERVGHRTALLLSAWPPDRSTSTAALMPSLSRTAAGSTQWPIASS